MDRNAYEEFCRDASLDLRLPDTGPLGQGGLIDVDGVEMQLLWGGQKHMQLFLEVGMLDDESRLEAYEAALAYQTQLAGQITGMFLFDAANDRLMFTLSIPMSERMAGEDLAFVLRGFAQQVTTWRNTILLGKVLPAGFEDGLQGNAAGGAALRV